MHELNTGRRGCDRMVVGFTTTRAISFITTTVSSNLACGAVYSIQHYVVSDLWQVGDFLRVL